MSDTPEHAGFLAPEPAELSPHFPGYEIEGLIATGGMGAVYRAVQKSLDRTVALKILPKELSKDAAFCDGFEAEAKAMARLNHPNLIGVYDFGAVNDMLFIIMEYVPGKSIYHSAYGKAIAPPEVIRLVCGVCEGLAHAHENGIIHRDIKPSNILLDVNALPKIGDFGLARPIERKIEEGEEIFGTPHYTAPEVVNAPHSVDHRADIFSVGVLLHELLTGKLPATDARPASLIARCDPRFDAIIRRATHPVASGRYSSASEIEKDLLAISSSNSAPSRGTSPGGPPRPMTRRSHTKARPKKSNSGPLVAFLIVAAIAAIAAFTLYSPKPSQELGTQALPAPQDTPTPTTSTKSDSLDDTAAKPLPTNSPSTDSSSLKPSSSPLDSKQNEKPTPPSAKNSSDFNADEFFLRVRKIMQDRGRPLITTYQSNILINLAQFERAVSTEMRKLKYRGQTGFSPTFAAWRADGGRIPEDADDSLDTIEDIDEISAPYLEQQTAYDQTLQQNLDSLSATYILGLNKQIERLQSENDSTGVAIIEREIERVEGESNYFSETILGVQLPTN